MTASAARPEREDFADALIESIEDLDHYFASDLDLEIFKRQVWDGYRWRIVAHDILDQGGTTWDGGQLCRTLATVEMTNAQVVFYCDKFKALAEEFIPDGKDLTAGTYVGHFDFSA